MENDKQIFGAVRALDFEAVRTLLAAGASANARNGNGQTPLHIAAGEGSAEICKLLIDAGADVEAEFDFDGSRPLSIAVWRGHEEVCKLLIDHGADYFLKNSRGDSAALQGQRQGRLPLHEFLLSYIAEKASAEIYEASGPATANGEKAGRGL